MEAHKHLAAPRHDVRTLTKNSFNLRAVGRVVQVEHAAAVAARNRAKIVTAAVVTIQRIWRGYFVRKICIPRMRETERIDTTYGTSYHAIFDMLLPRINAFEYKKDEAALASRLKSQRKGHLKDIMQNAVSGGAWKHLVTAATEADTPKPAPPSTVNPKMHLADAVLAIKRLRRRSTLVQPTSMPRPASTVVGRTSVVAMNAVGSSVDEEAAAEAHTPPVEDERIGSLMKLMKEHFRRIAEEIEVAAGPTTDMNEVQQRWDRVLAEKLCDKVKSVSHLGTLVARAQELLQSASHSTSGAANRPFPSFNTGKSEDVSVLNDERGYYFRHAMNEGHFFAILHAFGLMSGSLTYSVIHNIFCKHAVVLNEEAHMLHVKRRFEELVSADGTLPAVVLPTLVENAAVRIPRREVLDFTAHCAPALTWFDLKPWLDERRRQGEGRHPYCRDGFHPSSHSEAAISGLTKVGFAAAMRDITLQLCPPSPLCGCEACNSNRDATSSTRMISWATALLAGPFAEIHIPFVLRSVLSLAARTVDRCVRSDKWTFDGRVATLLLNNNLRRTVIEHEDSIGKLFAKLVAKRPGSPTSPSFDLSFFDPGQQEASFSSGEQLASVNFHKYGILPNVAAYRSWRDGGPSSLTVEQSVNMPRLSFSMFQSFLHTFALEDLLQEDASGNRDLNPYSFRGRRSALNSAMSGRFTVASTIDPVDNAIDTASRDLRLRNLLAVVRQAPAGVCSYDAYAACFLRNRSGWFHLCSYPPTIAPNIPLFRLLPPVWSDDRPVDASRGSMISRGSTVEGGVLTRSGDAIACARTPGAASSSMFALFSSIGQKAEPVLDLPAIESRIASHFDAAICDSCGHPQLYEYSTRQLWQLAVSFAAWAIRAEEMGDAFDSPEMGVIGGTVRGRISAPTEYYERARQLVFRDHFGLPSTTARIPLVDLESFLRHRGRNVDPLSMIFRRLVASLPTNPEGLLDWQDFITNLHIFDRSLNVIEQETLGFVEFTNLLMIIANDGVSAAAAKQAEAIIRSMTLSTNVADTDTLNSSILPIRFVHAPPAPKFRYLISRINARHRAIFNQDLTPASVVRQQVMLKDGELPFIENQMDIVLSRVFSAYAAIGRYSNVRPDFACDLVDADLSGLTAQQFTLFAQELRIAGDLSQKDVLTVFSLALTAVASDRASTAVPSVRSLWESDKSMFATGRLSLADCLHHTLTLEQFRIAVRLLLFSSYRAGQKLIGAGDEQSYFEPFSNETGLSPESVAVRLAVWRLTAQYIVYQPSSRMGPPSLRRHFYVKLPIIDPIIAEVTVEAHEDPGSPIHPSLDGEVVAESVTQVDVFPRRTAAARRASVAMREMQAVLQADESFEDGSSLHGRPTAKTLQDVSVSNSRLLDPTIVSNAKTQAKRNVTRRGKGKSGSKAADTLLESISRVQPVPRPPAKQLELYLLRDMALADAPLRRSRYQQKFQAVAEAMARTTEALTGQPLLLAHEVAEGSGARPLAPERPPASDASTSATARMRLWSGSLARRM